jgi:hypothetical protein
VRVVIGDRGPYVEFEERHMVPDSIYIPFSQRERAKDFDRYYYAELRSRDDAYTKIYYQFRSVDYADYKVGMFYISPFDLYQKTFDGSLQILIEPLRKKEERISRKIIL